MKIRSTILILLLSFFCINKGQAQANLKFDSNKNLVIKSNKKRRVVFPVMLYSFKNWEETKNENFWKQINTWGVNVLYSWDVANENVFISYANKYDIIPIVNSKANFKKSNIIALPDEPIGAGTADINSLKSIKKSVPKNALTYLNHDVTPYLYRKKHDTKSHALDSSYNCKWCKQGRGNDLSYTQANQYADIIAFDLYPFTNEGVITRNVSEDGQISVGEFTKIMKNKYPQKPIWPVIQTMWFNPFNDEYKGNVINFSIIRNLTFDAIVNGADGISFFGHGQTGEYELKNGYEYLKKHNDQIWYSTLKQCFELKELQTNYDNILLEDNLYSYSFINQGFSFAIKKVSSKSKYYFFVVNHNSISNQILLKFPTIIKGNKITKIGNYNIPKYNNVTNYESLDLRSIFTINNPKHNTIDLVLDPYAVAIFTLE